jgi:hypothetical protein
VSQVPGRAFSGNIAQKQDRGETTSQANLPEVDIKGVA